MFTVIGIVHLLLISTQIGVFSPAFVGISNSQFVCWLLQKCISVIPIRYDCADTFVCIVQAVIRSIASMPQLFFVIFLYIMIINFCFFYGALMSIVMIPLYISGFWKLGMSTLMYGLFPYVHVGQ